MNTLLSSRRQRSSLLAAVLVSISNLWGMSPVHAQTTRPSWFSGSREGLTAELTVQHGAAQKAVIQRGLDQMGGFWRAEDGDAAVFQAFVRANYAGDAATRDAMFARFENL